VCWKGYFNLDDHMCVGRVILILYIKATVVSVCLSGQFPGTARTHRQTSLWFCFL